jgi:hypothetical protein
LGGTFCRPFVNNYGGKEMTQVYSNPLREHDPFALPDFEVFWYDPIESKLGAMCDENGREYKAGFYYWPCYPGCLPDGDPVGPFDSEQEAIKHLRED